MDFKVLLELQFQFEIENRNSCIQIYCRTCSGCDNVRVGLTKEGSGLYRFTDGSSFDYEPTNFVITHYLSDHCHALNNGVLEDLSCLTAYNYICIIPGFLCIIRTLFILNTLFFTASRPIKFLYLR